MQPQLPQDEPLHHIAELLPDDPTPVPTVKRRQQLSVGLYAMNGLGNYDGANGVQMAGNWATMFSNTLTNSYSARAAEPMYLAGYEERQHHYRPVTFGLTVGCQLSTRLALTTGIVYTKLRSDFTQVMRNQEISRQQSLDYIGLPVNLNYTLWTHKRLHTYITGGVRADWNVATHLETEGTRQTMPRDRMQWSLNAGMGARYDVVPHVALYAEPTLNWYLDNGSKIQNYFKDKPLSIGLQIGLRLDVK